MSKNNKDANKSQKKWYFVTNHQNVLMYLAMNTITSTFINHKKYYKDSLLAYPGWIPLFSSKLPEWIINESQSGNEGDKVSLKPILLEIDLSNYNDKLFAYSENVSQWINISFSQLNDESFVSENDLDTSLIFISSQLATGYIHAIKTPTLEVQKQIEDKALDTNNINISAYKINSNKQLFQRTSDSLKLDHDTNTLPNIDHPQSSYRHSNAIAGVYAVLSLLANVNDQALLALLSLLKQSSPLAELPTNDEQDYARSYQQPLNEIIDNFCQWALQPSIEIKDPASKVFIESAKIVIESNNITKSKERIVELLNSKATDQHSQQFVADLSGKLGLSSKPFDELMETYSTRPLNRVLLMFFYAENVERLLELDKSKLKEFEIVLAAVLITINGGWLKLPSWIKSYAAIEKPMSFIMTRLGQLHKGLDSPTSQDELNNSLKVSVDSFDDIDFPMPVRHLLMNKWNKPQQDASPWL